MNAHYTALSPLDGRYAAKTASLRQYFSEAALFHYRAKVEISWLKCLIHTGLAPNFKADLAKLDALIANTYEEIELIKQHEKITNHDIKALEYYLKDKLATDIELKCLIELTHFAATSEDINNVAYALMLKDYLHTNFLPEITKLLDILKNLSVKYAAIPMLARTHGQAATPTTVGKELANFAYRLKRQLTQLENIEILAKFNGATGNFNAHMVAMPNINWLSIAQEFIASLGLTFNPYTTQIEPHDYLAEISHNIIRINNILLDLAKDCWHYISIDYFTQVAVGSEVGSSTMPHKINPIDFENAEGNLGLANSMFDFFANKLPISRLQRDLSDSTVLRNIGSAFGYSTIAYESLTKGLGKIGVNTAKLDTDLENNWEVLGEALQTVMRQHGVEQPYEKLKDLTRGKKLNQQELRTFITSLDLPMNIKDSLLHLTPQRYVGIAANLAKLIGDQ